MKLFLGLFLDMIIFSSSIPLSSSYAQSNSEKSIPELFLYDDETKFLSSSATSSDPYVTQTFYVKFNKDALSSDIFSLTLLDNSFTVTNPSITYWDDDPSAVSWSGKFDNDIPGSMSLTVNDRAYSSFIYTPTHTYHLRSFDNDVAIIEEKDRTNLRPENEEWMYNPPNDSLFLDIKNPIYYYIGIVVMISVLVVLCVNIKYKIYSLK